jgi:Tfp pilus assembly protein PilO
MRYITPVILIGIAIAFFFMVTNPIYNDISSKKGEVTSYNEALDNSKALANVRDQLTAKYNAIDSNNLIKLQTLLPDNVNNIRLILEIEQIASPFGMVLSDVKYDASTPAAGVAAADTATVVQGGNTNTSTSKDYGTFDLEFSTSGTYDNFINFTKSLESNLRIVDISSVSFSSDTAVSTSKTSSPDIYQYDFKIKTYWLKS